MDIIVINDDWNGLMNMEDLGDIRILCIENTVLEADVIVRVRDWLFDIYDGGYTEMNRHWTDRKALANAVVSYAIKHDKRFWNHVPNEVYLSVQSIFENIPKFTPKMNEEDVLSFNNPR